MRPGDELKVGIVQPMGKNSHRLDFSCTKIGEVRKLGSDMLQTTVMCCSFALNAEVDLFLSLKKGTAGSSGWQYVCSTKLSSGELICFNGGLSHNAGTAFS